MAGHRRAVNGRTTTGTTKHEAKQTRQRKALAKRLGEAQTHSQRVAAACDYARVALTTLSRKNQQAAEVETSRLVKHLTRAGDQMWKEASR